MRYGKRIDSFVLSCRPITQEACAKVALMIDHGAGTANRNAASEVLGGDLIDQ
jgi:hypothetical protein